MDELVIHERPPVRNPALVLGLTGWMDGGRVSTGTVGYLADKLQVSRLAEIRPQDFYILNFPLSTLPVSVYTEQGKAVIASVNPMEFAAVFRPHGEIRDGLVQRVTYPTNEFSCSRRANLLLFVGDEPHIRWGAYLDCLFRLAREFGVADFYFVGSVASPIPHTREPRLRASVSSPDLKPEVADLGCGFSDYEGPSSLTTSLIRSAPEHGIRMRSLVVEIPHYPFLDLPTYPRSILKTTAALNQLLQLDLDLSDLEAAAEALETKLNETMGENAEFQQLVAKLEQAYDEEQPSEDEDRLRRLIEGLDLEGEEE